tara:strand:+ start:513 stop:719 length:207 start_codon:yes stop_codon:yes gene_type:complete
MKNTYVSVKEKMVARYLNNNLVKNKAKSSNINVLLNRIEISKKNETRKKLFFSAAASTGLVLFGILIF